MVEDRPFQALVAPLRADVVSGAAVLARAAADVVLQAVGEAPASTAAEFRSHMEGLARAILDAQPAMAPLVALLADVLRAVGAAPDAESARSAARAAAVGFRSHIETRGLVVARRAAAVLASARRVLTVSSSTTVRRALELAAGERGPAVVCLEGRPGGEGRALAARLAERGLDVTLAVDAAAGVLAAGCDLVAVGADSIGDAGVVNKIGTSAVVDAARRLDLPVYVLADETKILPRGFPQPLDDDRPAAEVAPPIPGVRIWNRYFEAVPTELITAFITEAATLDARGVEALRRGLAVPRVLRTWAAARR